MLDENEHSRKEDGRSLHRLLHKTEQQDATVEVDSAAFFLGAAAGAICSAAPPPAAKHPPHHGVRGQMGHTSPRNEGRSC